VGGGGGGWAYVPAAISIGRTSRAVVSLGQGGLGVPLDGGRGLPNIASGISAGGGGEVHAETTRSPRANLASCSVGEAVDANARCVVDGLHKTPPSHRPAARVGEPNRSRQMRMRGVLPMARSTAGTEFGVGEEGDGAATWGACAPPWRDLRRVRGGGGGGGVGRIAAVGRRVRGPRALMAAAGVCGMRG
jgi:hypothetical protein